MKMESMKSRFVLHALVLFGVSLNLFGCASTGAEQSQRTEIPAGKATIYVYRPSSGLGIATLWSVAIDGNQAAILHSGEYIAAIVDPGLHVVGMGTMEGWRRPSDAVKGVPVDVSITAGQTRYVRIAMDHSDMRTYWDKPACCIKMVFQAIEERDAQPEIRGLAPTRTAEVAR